MNKNSKHTTNNPTRDSQTLTKEGYKLTKLGWFPEDWDIHLLKDLGRIGSGTTPSKTVKSYWKNGDIPWLPTGKVNDKIISNSQTFITSKALKEKNIKLLPIGTIVIAMIGQGQTRGKSALLNIEAWVNQNFAFIIPNDRVISEYLFRLLDFNYGRIRYEGDRGGSQGSLNTGMVKALKVVLPKVSEQKAIAQILSTWDKAIEKLTQLIKAKENKKKALMQQLLTGKKRFPGFEGEWEEYHLGDLFTRVTRKNAEKNTNVVTISAQRGFIKQTDFFNKKVASDTLDNYFLVEKGEFCYNKSYSNGYPKGATKRLIDFEKAVVTTLYICFGIKDENTTNGDFFEQYFEGII